MDPKARPSFEDIWKEIYFNDFNILPGVTRADIKSFLEWFEKSLVLFFDLNWK
jgi:hypothetical protein